MAYENYYNPMAFTGLNLNSPVQPNYAEQLTVLQNRLAEMEKQQQLAQQQAAQNLQTALYGAPPQMPLKDPKVVEFEKSKQCEEIYYKHLNRFIQEAGIMTQLRPQFESSKYYREDCYKDMQDAYGQFLNQKQEV